MDRVIVCLGELEGRREKGPLPLLYRAVVAWNYEKQTVCPKVNVA